MSPSLSALRFTLAVTLIPVLAATPSAAWGVDGHHIINHLAIVNLPESVPAFLRTPTAIDTVTYYAPLPDHWRGPGEPELKVATAPEHFFQMETLDRILPTLPPKKLKKKKIPPPPPPLSQKKKKKKKKKQLLTWIVVKSK